jgi:hypothetical protein
MSKHKQQRCVLSATKKRLHASLGYVPPADFEAAWLQNKSGHVLLTA